MNTFEFDVGANAVPHTGIITQDEPQENHHRQTTFSSPDSDWDNSDNDEKETDESPMPSRRRRSWNDLSESEDTPPPQKRRKQRKRQVAQGPEEERIHSAEKPRDEQMEEPETNVGDANTTKKRSRIPLRSPICVVMGHVDAGKTKILDAIRQTNVQGRESGGITQQIGATYLSIENMKTRTELLREHFPKLKYKVPGLLFIDTPGHESFSNLRARGSSMCDIAVVVVNILEDIKPQTIESLDLLRDRGVHVVVALNQIDRLNLWRSTPNAPFKTSFAGQNRASRRHFEKRLSALQGQLQCREWNSALYFENELFRQDVSLVPVSALTGEGLPDLLMVVMTLTQKLMKTRLQLSLAPQDFCCTVLEVKHTKGHGATIDVILSNGVLHVGDTIVVCGMGEPIVTPIRALLLPREAQEMRVRCPCSLVDEIGGSAGVRISAKGDLSRAVPGSSVMIVPRNLGKMEKREVLERLKDEVQFDWNEMTRICSSTKGVSVQASTLGAVEALVSELKKMRVPICGINVGDIHKSDVLKASLMHERGCPEFALILAFNVNVAVDAMQFARREQVQIFGEDVIFDLLERFSEHMKCVQQEKRKLAADVAVYPCRLEILPEHVICRGQPLILGCVVRRGSLRLGTPLVAQRSDTPGDFVYLGRVQSIRCDRSSKEVDVANEGERVAVKIVDATSAVARQFRRHFDETHHLVSQISRESIDALREHFRDYLRQNRDDCDHLRKLKHFFGVV